MVGERESLLAYLHQRPKVVQDPHPRGKDCLPIEQPYPPQEHLLSLIHQLLLLLAGT